MCDNNKYLKEGVVLRKLSAYYIANKGQEAADTYYAAYEKHWYTDDIREARLFERKASASCAAARGPLGYTVVEVERTVNISIKIK